MRKPIAHFGLFCVALGAATILIGVTPDSPFYGTSVLMARFYDEEAVAVGEEPVMDTVHEQPSRVAYAILGIFLCIGGSMLIEAHRYGGWQ